MSPGYIIERALLRFMGSFHANVEIELQIDFAKQSPFKQRRDWCLPIGTVSSLSAAANINDLLSGNKPLIHTCTC